MTAATKDMLWRAGVLTLTAIAARAMTFGSPVIHVDEPFYLTVAQAMSHGAIPYVDVWDRKPVGLFILYLPAAIWGLPTSLYAYQAMAAAAVVATALLIARLAERAGWRAGALPAAMLYILWLDLADGQGGQSPVFYNALMAAAALLAIGTPSRWRGLAATLVVGLALQVKYSVVFEGVGFGLWLLVDDWRARRSIGGSALYGAGLMSLALLPTGVAAAAYAAMGHFADFAFANFVSILRRGRDAPAVMAITARDAPAILSLLLLAVPGFRARAADGGERRVQLFVRLWLLVALLGFVGFGGWYNHYTLPVMLPGSIATAAVLGRRAAGRPRTWLWPAAPLALVFVAGQAILRSERAHRGTAAQFDALARAVGPGPGELLVYSGPVLLYAATGRPAPTRYLFPSHLEFVREAGSLGIDQRAEVERVLARRPAVVVMGPPIGEEDPAIRTLVEARLRHDGYRAAAPIRLGNGDLSVFRAPITTPPSPPAGR